MKGKLLLSAVTVIFLGSLLAQAPQGIGHQMVIRDAEGKLITGSTIGISVSILQGTAEGNVVYSETHEPLSNINGLVSYVIGQGTAVEGVFADIDWSDGPYFLKTEVDPAGGTSYSIEGTVQLQSVPYALHAQTSADAFDGDMQGERIVNLADPVGDQDAATKAYVDLLKERLAVLEGVVFTWPRDTETQVVDVTNPTTGKTWMDRNLGASRAAISSTDAEAYGDLYQWGRAADGHQKRTSETTSTLSSSDTPGHDNFILAPDSPNDWRSPQNDNLWQGVNGVNNPCPPGYRLPTSAELDAERASWYSNSSSGAFASPLKLPLGGFRGGNGSLYLAGWNGLYWSGTVDGINSRYLIFLGGNAYMDGDVRFAGISVRCLKD